MATKSYLNVNKGSESTKSNQQIKQNIKLGNHNNMLQSKSQASK
jgi:hypothetical protein